MPGPTRQTEAAQTNDDVLRVLQCRPCDPAVHRCSGMCNAATPSSDSFPSCTYALVFHLHLRLEVWIFRWLTGLYSLTLPTILENTFTAWEGLHEAKEAKVRGTWCIFVVVAGWSLRLSADTILDKRVAGCTWFRKSTVVPAALRAWLFEVLERCQSSFERVRVSEIQGRECAIATGKVSLQSETF